MGNIKSNIEAEQKMRDIISLAAEGKTKTEIAELLGYSTYRTLHGYTKRHGYRWNDDIKNYEKVETESEEEVPKPKYPKGRVGSVIEMFSKEIDSREIARKLRFKSPMEMADFMRSKGYTWSNDLNNYVFEPPAAEEKAEDLSASSGFISEFYSKYNDILNLLVKNKNKLENVLNSISDNEGTIPRYVVAGAMITKSLHIPNSIDMLCKEFSECKNISQKDIVIIALVEFFSKYGFKDEIKRLLNS